MHYLVLQTLVGIVLGYQLWFGVEPIAVRSLGGLILFGLVVILMTLIFVPKTILQSTCREMRGLTYIFPISS